jgi:dTDP-4-dehydrorhamnose reductase
MNVLITGSNGQLGNEIQELTAEYSNCNFFFTDKDELDIVDFEVVETYVLKNNIEIIINCAAYTNVDGAEEEPVLADEINHLAVKNLAEISKKQQLKLIHISTDYVFEGNSSEPYQEDDKTNPQNIYGNTKLNGEKAMLLINPANSIIIRTSWLYSEFGNNFVKTMLRLTNEKEEISVVNDQIGSPTYAKDLAKAILEMLPSIKNNTVEVFHYSNKGKCSWFQFAEAIVKIANHSCTVNPVSSEVFKSKAKRPNFSLLNTNKIENTFQIKIPVWEDSLKKCVLNLKK